MMAVMYHLTMAKVWWGEPVMLHILPLQGRQVREYITMRSSHQSGAWIHVQGRGVGTWPLPRMPNLDKGLSEAQVPMPLEELSRDVWDLDNDQLWEVLEALQTEMAWREA